MFFILIICSIRKVGFATEKKSNITRFRTFAQGIPKMRQTTNIGEHVLLDINIVATKD